MGELSLLPAVRKSAPDTIIVADGTSCRHQIHDGAAVKRIHVARVLAMSLGRGRGIPRLRAICLELPANTRTMRSNGGFARANNQNQKR